MAPTNQQPPRIVFSADTVDQVLSDDNRSSHSGSDNDYDQSIHSHTHKYNHDHKGASSHRLSGYSDDEAFSELDLMSLSGDGPPPDDASFTTSLKNNHLYPRTSQRRPSFRRHGSSTLQANPTDANYKRLSIFTDNHKTVEDQVVDQIASLSKKKKNTDTSSHGLTGKISRRDKKPLKIIIPDNASNDPMKLSPRLNTPISFHHSGQLEDDFTSTLDDALFKSAWMPTKDNKSTLLTPPTFSQNNSSPSDFSGSSNSNSSLRQRKRKNSFNSSHSDSFHHDLENNDAIPLSNLNFSVPNIQVDNYMDNQSPVKHSQAYNTSTSNNNEDNPSKSVLEIEHDSNSSLYLTPPLTPSSNDDNINKGSTVTKMFAKISNLVNSDNIDIETKSPSNATPDNVSFFSSRNTNGSTTNLKDNPFELDPNRNDDRLNTALDVKSIYSFYMNETEHRYLSENSQDEIYTMDPFSSKAEVLTTTNEINNDSEIISDELKNDELPLFGKSLKQFNSKSKLRQTCYLILTYPSMNQVFTLMLIIQVGILSYQQWKSENGYVSAARYTWADWILFVFYFIYTVEMCAKIIAFGLYDDSEMVQALRLQRYENELQKFYSNLYKRLKKSKYTKAPSFFKAKTFNHIRKRKEKSLFLDHSQLADGPGSSSEMDDVSKVESSVNDKTSVNKFDKFPIHYAFFRTDWNRIDFISIACFWISFFLSLERRDIGKYQVFRSLMCLRILRLLNITKGSRVILKGLKDSALQAKQVLALLVCFWILLSIIGVESFKASFKRHCVWTNPNDPTDTYSNEFQFCGSYLDAQTLQPMAYFDELHLSTESIKGYTCPVNSKCIMTENPYNNRVSFDNIAQSMQSVFVVMSANTFTDLMYYTMDSDSMVSSLFFIISLFVLTVWMINLFVAVIIHSYKEEDKSRKSHNSWHKKYRNLYAKFTEKPKIFKISRKLDVVFIIIIFISFVYNCTKQRVNGEIPKKYNLCDFVTSIIMLFEIIGRFCLFVYAGNWKVFFYSVFNWVDLISAIFAFVFSLPPVFNSLDTTVYGWLSIFGIIRFYRVVRFIKPIRKSWELALKRTRPFAELILFGAMLLYFSGIIMSRLFEGIVPISEMSDDQWIMCNLPNCIVSLFIITTTENWTNVLYVAEKYSPNTFTALCVAIYLISWFAISNTVLLSIFIAIITDNLELPEAEKRITQIKQFVKSCVAKVKNNEHEGLVDLIKNNFDRTAVSEEANHFINRMNELLIANGQTPIDVENFDDDDRDLLSVNVRELKTIWRKVYMENTVFLKSLKRNFIALLLSVKKRVSLLLGKAFELERHISPFALLVNLLKEKLQNVLHKTQDLDEVTSLDLANPFNSKSEVLDRYKKTHPQIDRSLFVFTNYNPIRRICQMIVSPSNLQRTEGRQPAPKLMYACNVFMFLASVAVVILTCYETPLYRRSISPVLTANIWSSYADVVFMVIFSVEFSIKIIADGFLFGPRAYVKSTWNNLDFIVLISFWVTVLSVINNNYSLLVTFGALKAFRAFRLLTITKESQLVFHFAIISGAYKILSAALVSLSLLIPFALWGLNIFSMELSYCADGVSNISNCTLEYTNTVFKWEVYSPNYVETPYLYFDSFGTSIRSLFEILSLEGWVDLLSNVMNITTYGEQPQIFNSVGNGVFVIIFIFCSTVFIINLFISIIINNYSIQTGAAFLNNEQYGWYEVKKVLSMVKPSKRRDDGDISQIQKRVFRFVSKKDGAWSVFIKTVLLLHFLLLISESYPYSIAGNTARYGLFIVSTTILLIHMILLQFSLGTKVFYSNKWNLIMTIVIITALTMTSISFAVSDTSVYTNINKAFLVAVLCLIIPQVDMLNQLIKYGSTGLFSLISLLYTWLVLFLVFAIALNQLFGLTRLGPNTTGNLNARTVTKALIMLFRNSFGEGWNYIMRDFEILEPYCYDNGYGDSDCGNVTLALVLFICWNILSMYIFLNILISVIITNFSYIYHGSGPHKLITREELRKFKRAWNQFDVNGSGYIYEADLFKFMHSLDGILSYNVYPKYLSLPAIAENTIVCRNPNNGYDIECNLTRLEEILAFIDFRKVRMRRIRYERLISELLACSVEISVNDSDDTETAVIRKIPFKESLLVIGYYSRFEDSTCLNLEDFLRHSTQIKNINRELRKAKIVSTIKMTFTRLRYKFAVDKMRIFDKIARASPFEKEMLKEDLRNSLKGADLSFDVLTDNTFRVVDPENPIFNNNLYKVMSASSRNPFSDVYVANRSCESIVSTDE